MPPTTLPDPTLDQYSRASSDRVFRELGYRVPPAMVRAVVRAESTDSPGARSPAGALGLMQLMPDTARGFHVDPMNPTQNMYAGTKYLAQLLKQYRGNQQLALAAYNAGPGAVAKYGGIPPYTETQNYVRNVMALEQGYRDLAGPSPSSPPVPVVPGTGTPAQSPAPPRLPEPTIARGIAQQTAALSQQLAPSQSEVDIFSRLGGTAAKVLQQSAPSVSPPLAPTIPTAHTKYPDIPTSIQVYRGPKIAVQVTHNQTISPQAAPLIRLAQHYLGTPYVWGGTDPKKGFDCSGFVQWLYKRQGINLPRSTYDQIKVGQGVGINNLQPGDIVFFGSKADPHHEGLYIGKGQFIHAPHTGDVIKISTLTGYYRDHFVAARRVTNP